MKRVYHDPKDKSKGWMLRKDDEPSGGWSPGVKKAAKAVGAGAKKAKEDVKKHFSKEERTKIKKGRLTKRANRISERTKNRKVKTQKLTDKAKRLREEAATLKKGGSIGSSVKTYSSGGYVEGK